MTIAAYPVRNSPVDDAATQELMRRLTIGPAPPPSVPQRFLGQSASPSIETPNPAPAYEQELRSMAQRYQPSSTATYPQRVNTDTMGEPPAPAPIDYSKRAVQNMEALSKNLDETAPVADYSNASTRDEMGIEYYERTGHVRPKNEAPAQVTTGVTYKPREQPLPPATKIPTLSGGSVVDSTVMPAVNTNALKTAIEGPKRLIDPDHRDVPRQAGESDAEYNLRLDTEYQKDLRSAGTRQKVEKGDTGIDVAPPPPGGYGPKKRLGQGAKLAVRTLNAGVKYGPGGALGSTIASILTGLFAPSVESKLQRQDEINAAETQSKSDQEIADREHQAKMDAAKMDELRALPQRRREASDEQQRDNLRAQWQIISNSPSGFDPVHDPDHKKIQDAAAALGVVLPSVTAKPGTQPKRGLENATTVADASGNTFYVDKTTGQPIPDPKDPTGRTPLYAHRVPPTTDVAGENAVARNEAERAQSRQLEGQARAQAERFQQQASDFASQADLLEKEIAGYGSTPVEYLSARQRGTIARLGRLRTQAKEAAAKATEWWQKRAEYDIKAQTLPTLKTKPSKGGVSNSTSKFAGRQWSASQYKASHPTATAAEIDQKAAKARNAGMEVIQ